MSTTNTTLHREYNATPRVQGYIMSATTLREYNATPRVQGYTTSTTILREWQRNPHRDTSVLIKTRKLLLKCNVSRETIRFLRQNMKKPTFTRKHPQITQNALRGDVLIPTTICKRRPKCSEACQNRYMYLKSSENKISESCLKHTTGKNAPLGCAYSNKFHQNSKRRIVSRETMRLLVIICLNNVQNCNSMETKLRLNAKKQPQNRGKHHENHEKRRENAEITHKTLQKTINAGFCRRRFFTSNPAIPAIFVKKQVSCVFALLLKK